MEGVKDHVAVFPQIRRGGGALVALRNTFKPIFHCDAKYLASGVGVGQCPDTRILRWRYQHVGIFWHYLTLKFALALTQNLKFALATMPTPDNSQWNIGGVGPSGVGAGVGHVHFMFFVLISFALRSQRKPSFQWNMGLNVSIHADLALNGRFMAFYS